MTPLQQIEFAAKVQIGSIITGSGGMEMVVTGTDKYGWKGYSKYVFEKYGKKNEIGLAFKTLQNPHYNKNLSITTP